MTNIRLSSLHAIKCQHKWQQLKQVPYTVKAVKPCQKKITVLRFDWVTVFRTAYLFIAAVYSMYMHSMQFIFACHDHLHLSKCANVHFTAMHCIFNISFLTHNLIRLTFLLKFWFEMQSNLIIISEMITGMWQNEAMLLKLFTYRIMQTISL